MRPSRCRGLKPKWARHVSELPKASRWEIPEIPRPKLLDDIGQIRSAGERAADDISMIRSDMDSEAATRRREFRWMVALLVVGVLLAGVTAWLTAVSLRVVPPAQTDPAPVELSVTGPEK